MKRLAFETVFVMGVTVCAGGILLIALGLLTVHGFREMLGIEV